MRKTWLVVAACLAVCAIIGAAALSGGMFRAAADDNDAAAHLPIVLKPENTPTPSATPTATATLPPTATLVPTTGATIVLSPPATLTPNATPTPGFGHNWLVNGSFEGGWTNMEPVDGFLINQQPDGWKLDWLEKGEQVWDLRTSNPNNPQVGIVTGIAEMLHKLKNQLPVDEQPGGPKALILEGVQTYNMFHRGAAFGSQLYQEVALPAGSWRLTVPVQLHWHEKLDPNDMTWDTFTAESGAWVLTGAMQAGGWANARDMGDRRWFYHVIEFNLPAPTEVGVLIRVKSIYASPKDFFVDAVWLEPLDGSALNIGPEDGRRGWAPRPLDEIPADELVAP